MRVVCGHAQPELLKLSSLPALTSSSAVTDTSEENVADRLEPSRRWAPAARVHRDV